ncbi:ATP-binding cassette domain-containing protein [Corynebacterium sp. 153RC1]|uniref:ATP-binding cassette domain-containing protein n=1 Tax=unclassified Corynebacterium TaxID=2624378 RepID=UPI00211CEDF9|nr:ATP-binding cassette domain-containing protein [Corynebacterium sp. 209RC1]MCQ9353739.1 ATP-binding cassette domain-containing protein [Corynebacterium sp. 1222RC1]MCQ9356277.1 ATP-binding cassette domain-containing protein [Corynebacterium sp. 122RC1]MCQ9358379.1 ATP-binding cassette domain-containing protein [Corynebacterium sp. 142RC1]MCQ9360886.1 ATP-binding cassette domain-containing protein [Corynebacterium sp. 153RC1]MCQ9362820.1 ATP-binding cassette domain-containing protein [Coryne
MDFVVVDGLMQRLASGDCVVVGASEGSERVALALQEQALRAGKSSAVVFRDGMRHLSYLRSRVDEEVALPLEQRGWQQVRMAARVEELLAQLGLSELADADPTHLSGGQVQRVAVASTASWGPDVLIFEDPFAGLDVDSVGRLCALMHSYPGVVVLCVSANSAGVEQLRGSGEVEVVGELPELPALGVELDLDGASVAPLEEWVELGELNARRGSQRRGCLRGRKPAHRQLRQSREFEVHVPAEKLRLQKGAVTWLRGPNGAGKTTVLRALAGLDGHEGCQKNIGGSFGLALQRAQDQVAQTSVGEMLAQVTCQREQVARVCAALGVPFDAHPLDVTAAQLRAVQVFAQLGGPHLVVGLDEPDVGLDPAAELVVHQVLADALREGKAVLLTCHNERFVRRVATYAEVRELHL